MTKAIRQTKRPVLGFKILGAGRAGSTKDQIEAAFRFAYANIKPTDAVMTSIARFAMRLKPWRDACASNSSAGAGAATIFRARTGLRVLTDTRDELLLRAWAVVPGIRTSSTPPATPLRRPLRDRAPPLACLT